MSLKRGIAFQAFLKDTKRRLQEVGMEVINLRVEKKASIETLKVWEEESRTLKTEQNSVKKC